MAGAVTIVFKRAICTVACRPLYPVQARYLNCEDAQTNTQ